MKTIKFLLLLLLLFLVSGCSEKNRFLNCDGIETGSYGSLSLNQKVTPEDTQEIHSYLLTLTQNFYTYSINGKICQKDGVNFHCGNQDCFMKRGSSELCKSMRYDYMHLDLESGKYFEILYQPDLQKNEYFKHTYQLSCRSLGD